MPVTEMFLRAQAEAFGFTPVFAWPLTAVDRDHLAWCLDCWEMEGRRATVPLAEGLYLTPDGGAIVHATTCTGVTRTGHGSYRWRHTLTVVPHLWAPDGPTRRTGALARYVSRGWASWLRLNGKDDGVLHQLTRAAHTLLRPALAPSPAPDDEHIVQWARGRPPGSWEVLRSASFEAACPVTPPAHQPRLWPPPPPPAWLQALRARN